MLNCQESRSLAELVLDRNLSGGMKRRFDRHLSRCEGCRAFFAAEQAEHKRWFRAVNSPDEPRHSLPPDFADRLAAAVVAKSLAQKPFFRRFRIPRWAQIAASLVALASFVTVAAVVVEGLRDAAVANQDAESGSDEPIALGGTEATSSDPTEDVPVVSSISNVSSVASTTSAKGANGIKKNNARKVMIVALASATLAASPASATTLPWSQGATELDGKIVITYDTTETDKIKTLVATPADGETLTVTGDPMTFATGATISMAAEGSLVFANDVTADGALSLDRTDGAYDSWTATTTSISDSKGYCLRSSGGSIVFENKNYQDWELVGAFAFADAKLTRPVANQKLGNHSAVSADDPKGVWTYTNLGGAYRRLATSEVTANSIFYRFNRWTGEYTYSIRIRLLQSSNGNNIVAYLASGVCGKKFGRYPEMSLWNSGHAYWSGWYGNSGDSTHPTCFGSPVALGVNRLVIRKNGSDVATVGFSGEVSLGGRTDVALGVKLAVLPKGGSAFAAPVFSGEGDVEFQRDATLANANLMKYASNLSVSNAQITVTHTGAFPTNAVVDIWNGGVVLADLGTSLNNRTGISDGWYDLNVRKGGLFQTKKGMVGGIGNYQLVEADGGEIWIGDPAPAANSAEDGTTTGNGRYVRSLTLMNGAVTKGYRIRVGYPDEDATCLLPYWHVCGTSPSTNECVIGMLKGPGGAGLFTIDVDDVCDGAPDFTCNGNIMSAGGVNSPSSFVKAGDGTMEMNGLIQTYTGYKTYCDAGTLLFGARGGFSALSYSSKEVGLRGGTLAKASGALTCGTLSVGAAGGSLELGADATMTFADSSGMAWDGPLTIKGFREKAIRFGTSSDALTPAQQTLIKTEEGRKLHLLVNGYLAPRGLSIVIR